MNDSTGHEPLETGTSRWQLLPPGETSLGYLTRGETWMHYDHLPVLFHAYAGSTHGSTERLYLGILIEEPDELDGKETVFLLAETDMSTMEAAQSGGIPLRDLFIQSKSCVLIRHTFDGETYGWEIEPAPNPLPESMLSKPGARLRKGGS